MTSLKSFLLLFACLSATAGASDLPATSTVYVLPMSRGLDQYLANRLTNEHLFQVVTDPKLADIIFTDHLGEAFELQLEAISPTPESKEAKEKEEKKEKEKAADVGSDSVNSMFAAPVNKLQTPTSSFGHNKGTVFLVDAKSRRVLWSVYEPMIGFSGRDMDHAASEVVNHLKKDLKRK